MCLVLIKSHSGTVLFQQGPGCVLQRFSFHGDCRFYSEMVALLGSKGRSGQNKLYLSSN